MRTSDSIVGIIGDIQTARKGVRSKGEVDVKSSRTKQIRQAKDASSDAPVLIEFGTKMSKRRVAGKMTYTIVIAVHDQVAAQRWTGCFIDGQNFAVGGIAEAKALHTQLGKCIASCEKFQASGRYDFG
ncbi:MAG TPA: hypothetical protein VIE65_08960 [Methylobacter sp.]